MTTGEKIRAARKQKKMTQKDLAKALDVSYQAIQQWENGNRKPKYENLIAMANALDVDRTELLQEIHRKGGHGQMSLTISYDCELGKQGNCDRTFYNTFGNGGDELVCHLCEHGKKVTRDDDEQPDMVNSPPHYRAGNIECIDAIAAALTCHKDPMQAWLTGQVLKYLWRWPLKNGVEDLRKAQWYLNRLIGMVGE